LHKEIRSIIRAGTRVETDEEQCRFVIDHVPDVILRMDRQFRIIYVSPSVLSMFGYLPEEMQQLPSLEMLIGKEFRTEMRNEYLSMVHARQPIILTHQAIHRNGTTFWAESLVNPVFENSSCRFKESVTVIRNISARMAYEESLAEDARQKDVMLREIHHRVKNQFAILVNLMNMQKTNPNEQDPALFFTELQGRIRTMALLHEMLYQSFDTENIDFGQYLSQLLPVITTAFHRKAIRVHHHFDPCILGMEMAMPLSLIVNELITNTYKYAFPDHQQGDLWVELALDHHHPSGDQIYSHKLVIRDNGKGLPEGFSIENQPTMGSQIITLLADQIEARLLVSGEKPGTSFTIYFSDEQKG